MDTVGWLLVGTGDIAGKRVLPALADEPRSRIAGICSRTMDRARDVASPHGAAAYDDLSHALAASDVDAVYLATPVDLHVPHAIQALRAGKHVLVEKPLAMNYPQASELVRAADVAGLVCGVAFYRRFYPKVAMAAKMLRDGEFGQVILVRLAHFSWYNPTPDDPKFWRVLPERSGGGPLADIGSHMIDLLIGLLGEPQRICAKTATLTHDYEVEDSAVAIFQMPDGAQGTLSVHWNSKTWTHEFEIVGTEAKVKWDPFDGDTVVKTVGRDVRQVSTPPHENVHYPLVEDFVSAILEDREPGVPVAEAARTNRFLDALYLSSRESREVALSEITA